MALETCFRCGFDNFNLYVIVSVYGYSAKVWDNEMHQWVVLQQIAKSEEHAKQIAVHELAKLLPPAKAEQLRSDPRWFAC
jgi:hypothetical protein